MELRSSGQAFDHSTDISEWRPCLAYFVPWHRRTHVHTHTQTHTQTHTGVLKGTKLGDLEASIGEEKGYFSLYSPRFSSWSPIKLD